MDRLKSPRSTAATFPMKSARVGWFTRRSLVDGQGKRPLPPPCEMLDRGRTLTAWRATNQRRALSNGAADRACTPNRRPELMAHLRLQKKAARRLPCGRHQANGIRQPGGKDVRPCAGLTV